MELITVRHLTHCYQRNKAALQDVNLDIGSGMFGLLGPNGSGKTTLIRILVTLLKPTSGKVSINGMDLQKNRKQIRQMTGYVPQEFSSFPKLTAWEFLDYVGSLRMIRPKRKRQALVEKVLEDVGLFEARDRKASNLSGGMKRRLGIAQILIGNPQIMIIDEPTSGLDPEERIRFRNLLSDLSRQDKIILLSTHIVGDISSTCSRIVLLNEGQVAFNGTPANLTAGVRGKVWSVSVMPEELDGFKAKYPVISAIPSEAGYQLRLVADDFAGGAAVPAEPNLEDAYVYFMRSKAGRVCELAEPSPFS